MTPKKKAKQLFEKFKPFVHNTSNWNEYDEFLETQNAKQCLIVHVDETIDLFENIIRPMNDQLDYWCKVKKEIEKI